MSGQGGWSERPPGTEDESFSEHGDDPSSGNRNLSTEYKNDSSGFHREMKGEGASYEPVRRAELPQKLRQQESDYNTNKKDSRSRSRSPKHKARRSRSSSSSRGNFRRNRRYSNSSSQRSRSSSREKSTKYRKRSRSRSSHRYEVKESDRYKRRIRGKSRSSSSSPCSTDRTRSRERKYKRQEKSPVRKYDSRNFSKSFHNSRSREEESLHSRKTSKPYKMYNNQRDTSYNKNIATTSKPIVPVFKNDGSFLELFKKMQQSTESQQGTSNTNPATEQTPTEQIKKPAAPLVGKRRGGRVLKTGMVKKAKTIEEQTMDNPSDAWSLYLQEVKKYRETSCEEEGKTRPLVK